MNRIIECYLDAWRNWNNFSGRTRRSGYWYAFLANVIIVFVLGVLSGITDLFEVVSGLYSLVYLVPSLALTTRRLHDTNHSAWWLLVICLVPGVCGAIIAVAAGVALALAFTGGSAGGLVALILVLLLVCLACSILFLVLMVKDSGPDNRYGPNPKGYSGMGYGPGGPSYGGPEAGGPQQGYQYSPDYKGPEL